MLRFGNTVTAACGSFPLSLSLWLDVRLLLCSRWSFEEVYCCCCCCYRPPRQAMMVLMMMTMMWSLKHNMTRKRLARGSLYGLMRDLLCVCGEINAQVEEQERRPYTRTTTPKDDSHDKYQQHDKTRRAKAQRNAMMVMLMLKTQPNRWHAPTQTCAVIQSVASKTHTTKQSPLHLPLSSHSSIQCCQISPFQRILSKFINFPLNSPKIVKIYNISKKNPSG